MTAETVLDTLRRTHPKELAAVEALMQNDPLTAIRQAALCALWSAYKAKLPYDQFIDITKVAERLLVQIGMIETMKKFRDDPIGPESLHHVLVYAVDALYSDLQTLKNLHEVLCQPSNSSPPPHTPASSPSGGLATSTGSKPKPQSPEFSMPSSKAGPDGD